MENQDLGSKKMNNKQVNLEDKPTINQSKSILKPEIEIDNEGHSKIVQRARNVEEIVESSEIYTNKNLASKPSTASEEIGKKMVENKDKNSDITPNRYPNSSPDNQENRGNL